MFTYIYNGVTHSNTTTSYMTLLGMTDEQILSVSQQLAFEQQQNVERRKSAYAAESDPLYMEWQFDGTAETEMAWRNKVREIKARFPLSTT